MHPPMTYLVEILGVLSARVRNLVANYFLNSECSLSGALVDGSALDVVGRSPRPPRMTCIFAVNS